MGTRPIKVWTAEEIHEIAKSKGWWEGDRNYGEVFANIWSEIAEAQEYLIFRRNTEAVSWVGDKPEGFGIELADAVIRILDFKCHLGIDGVGYQVFYHLLTKTPEVDKEYVLYYRLAAVSYHLCKAWEFYTKGDDLNTVKIIDSKRDGVPLRLNCAIYEIFETIRLLSVHEVNYYIDIKMKYNETREYRHGGKRA
jgi:hypothetical protein